MSVRAIAIPGAMVQIASATLLGMGLAYLLGWSFAAGLVFGLALSVASTVVLLRAMQERRLIETERGRIAVGWLVVEDLVMILTLVLLPSLAGILNGDAGAGFGAVAVPLLITLGKVAAFVAIMLVIGKRLIPCCCTMWRTPVRGNCSGSAVLAIALGVALGASVLFDVSFALGAFFAGMILSESELSQRAAQETLPLRDAFAVLFFVSVGMLVDPMIVMRDPLPLLATVLIIVFGKSIAAYRHRAHVRLSQFACAHDFGEPRPDRRILLHPGRASALRLLCCRSAAAISSWLARSYRSCSIRCCSPALDRLPCKPQARRTRRPTRSRTARPRRSQPASRCQSTVLTDHVVLVGYGRVGRIVAVDAQGCSSFRFS